MSTTKNGIDVIWISTMAESETTRDDMGYDHQPAECGGIQNTGHPDGSLYFFFSFPIAKIFEFTSASL